MQAKHMSTAILISLVLAAATESKTAQALDYVGQLAANMEPDRVVVYKKVGERELHLNIFEPEEFIRTDRRACFLTIHGGGWTGLEPRRQYPFAAHFATRGLVGIAIEYRLVIR